MGRSGNKVECRIEEVVMDNDDGRKVHGLMATCSQCDHTTESFGTTDKSAKRCLALMREECPQGGDNFYVDGDDT